MAKFCIDLSMAGLEGGKPRVYTEVFPSITAREYKEPRLIMEVKVIGQIDNTIDHTFESANRVYDVGGVSPTINTCGGGGLQPKIISKVKQLGFLDNGTGKHQSNTVYDENHISPSITTIEGGGTQQIKVLTEVDMNPKLLGGIGEKWGDKQYRQGNRVYDSNGVAMALTAQPLGNNGGNSYMYLTEEKTIVAMRGRNPENPSDRTVGGPTQQRLEPNSKGMCNTITSVQKDNLVMETVKIKQATKDGYIECQVGGIADLSFPDSETRRGRVQDNGQVSPTLMAGESDICRIEKVGQISNDGSQYGTVISENGICSTLSAGTHGYANNCIQTQYRIRKLTPKECWRLMNFSDKDFEKAAEVNSNTQLYKQAGNSIVKNCLVAIIGQMIEGKENVYKEV